MKIWNRSWMQRILALVGVAAVMGIIGCSGSTAPLATTQLTIATSSATVNINGSVTLTATLASSSTAQAPIGVVTFYDGSTYLQAAIVTGKTSVSLTTNALVLGTNSLTAVYGGDPTHATSTSQPVVVTVYQPTSTIVTALPALAGVNQPVVLTATVTAGVNTASGTVTFSSGATVLGTAALTPQASGSTASITTSSLPLGSNAVTATFAANGSFSASTSAPITVQVVSFTPTSTVLTTSPAGTVASGTAVTLTAAVTPTVLKAALTGTVTFYDGTVNLGTVSASTQPISLTVKQFVVGSNSLTAVYSGDVNYGASTSSAIGVTLSAYTGATYTNPLNMTDTVNKTGKVYNCPDPAIIKSQTGSVDTWYAYCTGDAFNSADTVTVGGAFRQHLISIFSSTDLVNWSYVRDAFSALPTWVAANNELQTPAIKLIGSTYYLYYEAPATKASPNGSAIGVGTATTPAGPFTDSGAPVINQQLACGNTCNRTVYSPEVIADQSGQYWIAYGGVLGGLSIRQLGPTYTTSVASSEVNIAIDNYYTNPYVLYQNGYYYEFATAGACCGGAFSTYTARVGRSKSITGPYLDNEGNDLNAFAPSNNLTAAAPGGDTVLVNTGNTIFGPGSNTVFQDESGQYYIFYSGVSSNQQYLPNATGYTARQLMMDPLDWVNGWPVVRNGNGDSDAAQPTPAAQPAATNGYVPQPYTADAPGTLMTAYSQDFTGATSFNSEFSFIHQNPATSCLDSVTFAPLPGVTPGFGSTGYTLCSNFADSTGTTPPYAMAQLPILAESEPTGNYLVEIKLHSLVPATGCCGYNYSGQGLLIYNSDTNYLRMDEFADFDTRQIEFLDEFGSANNLAFAPVGTPNFSTNTYMRIAKRINATTGVATWTSYSSIDGITYVRGPAWTTTYTGASKIGIFAGNLSYGATFSYIHVSSLTP